MGNPLAHGGNNWLRNLLDPAADSAGSGYDSRHQAVRIWWTVQSAAVPDFLEIAGHQGSCGVVGCHPQTPPRASCPRRRETFMTVVNEPLVGYALTLLRTLPVVSRLSLAISPPHRRCRAHYRPRAETCVAFAEDEVCPRVYVVRRGLLKQLYTKDDGTEWIKSFAREGELFGCPIALTPAAGPRSRASPSNQPWWSPRNGGSSKTWPDQPGVAEGDSISVSAPRRSEGAAGTGPVDAVGRRSLPPAGGRVSGLIARVPQKDLAAFLGVTPVGLNRIIRRVAPSRRREVRAVSDQPPSTCFRWCSMCAT